MLHSLKVLSRQAAFRASDPWLCADAAATRRRAHPAPAQLLQGALPLRRLRAVAGALDLLSLPLFALLPPWTHSQQQFAWGKGGALLPGGDAACHATLAFTHVSLGTLLPLLVAVWSWQPPAAAAHARTSQSAAAATGFGGQLQKLRRHASSAAASADVALAQFLCGPGGRAGVAWLLLATTWLCCRTLALPL